jgi:hypothetical protein
MVGPALLVVFAPRHQMVCGELHGALVIPHGAPSSAALGKSILIALSSIFATRGTREVKGDSKASPYPA